VGKGGGGERRGIVEHGMFRFFSTTFV